MGIGPRISCSDSYTASTKTAPNPNKYRYTIEGLEKMGGYVLVLVHYPDCTTFKGRKIMLYRDTDDLTKRTDLDPHFLEHEWAPIARFPANDEGLELGRLLMKTLSEKA